MMLNESIERLTAVLATIQLEDGKLLSERDARAIATEALAHAVMLNGDNQ